MGGVLKWAMLIVACLYLIVFWQQSQNGRYELKEVGEQRFLLDTRNGSVYVLSQGKWTALPPIPH